MVTHTCSTIAKFTDEDTAEYFSATLLENPCDDDTREMVRGILLEARPNTRLAGVVCDSLFALIDVIEKQERKKQQKQGNMTTAAPPIASSPPPTNTIRPKTKKAHTPPKDCQVTPVISNNKTKKKKKKKKQQQTTPPKTKTKTKTTHEIKRPIVTAAEVNRYLQHVQNKPELDEFPMNNPKIGTQIAEREVAYYKIRHTNSVLAEVDMEFYHSLPPVQVLLREMTRLENLAMSLEENANSGPTISTTTGTTVHHPTTENRNENSRLDTSSDNTSTTVTTNTTNTTTTTTTDAATTTTTNTIGAIPSSKPTADQLQSKNRTGKDTTSETETNNNNNNDDNPVKVEAGPSDHLL